MRKKRSGRLGGCLAVVALLCLAGAAVLGVLSLREPYGNFSGDGVFLDIAKGTSTRAIANKLAALGIIRSPAQLLLVRALHPSKAIQAGEYLFAGTASTLTVFDRLTRGDIYYLELTVPEGSNMFDVAGLAGELGWIDPADFLAIAGDPTSIRDLDPRAPSLEGYLFPSTYRVTRKTTARQICHLMTSQFRKQWTALGGAKKDVHSTVVLASLIEKETAAPQERPLIASVFRNRLDKGMTLDCDPTTIYAAMLEKRFRGVIHRSDLRSENAYNTYRHAGLPPGPITNPGLASIKAAIAPAATGYLYFVAKPDGSGSRFARTMEEHNRNVKEYRRGLQAKSESTASQRVSAARPSASRR
jgi:UPF0755 protein